MTELIQPLSDVAPMRQVPAQPRTSAHPPSFTELVYAHHDWWRARQAGKADRELAAAYGEIRAAFEAHQETPHFRSMILEEALPKLAKRERLQYVPL